MAPYTTLYGYFTTGSKIPAKYLLDICNLELVSKECVFHISVHFESTYILLWSTNVNTSKMHHNVENARLNRMWERRSIDILIDFCLVIEMFGNIIGTTSTTFRPLSAFGITTLLLCQENRSEKLHSIQYCHF